MDFTNLVPLYIDKSTGKKIATGSPGNSGGGGNSPVVLIELTSNGDHRHSVGLNSAQALGLISGSVTTVEATSSSNDNHTHTVTIQYNNGQFFVTDITMNHMHGFIVVGAGGGGGVGAIGYQHEQLSAQQTWTITHNNGSTNCVTQVYVGGELVIPTRIRFVGINTIEIFFNEPIAGFSNTVFFTQA